MERRNFIKKTLTGAAGLMVAPTIIPASVLTGKNAPSNKLHIAQIGCGRMGHGDMFSTMGYDTARMVALCDLDRNRLDGTGTEVEEFYKKKGETKVSVAKYDDYRELLLSKDVDAVIISTPDHWHSQPAMEAAIAGKDIYVQKPTSLTIQEGRQLCEVIRKTNVILQVGTQQRSQSQFRIACELVRNGRIGKLHTIRIGLPGDPPGPVVAEQPVPAGFNYDAWLGATPYLPYNELRVHPQKGYDRPGWLRIEQFGAGMITGWGQHHFDIAQWGMDTDYTGPISVEAVAEFPKSGVWDVHGDFMSKAEYANGVTVFATGSYPNGIRFEGDEGWIFVTRGNYRATASDPVDEKNNQQALSASDPKILKSEIGENEIHLYDSKDQYGNWLDCIKSRKQPVSPIEAGHRACSVCLLTHIAMHLPRKLNWDPANERFVNDEEANSWLSRPQRAPYGTNNVYKKIL
jgi:predicted dehydrogenase